MSVSYRSSTTATSDDDVATLSFSKPSGLTAGDMMVMCGLASNAWTSATHSTSKVPPSGWTLVTRSASDNNDDLIVFAKVATASDADGTNFPAVFTASNANRPQVGILMAIKSDNGFTGASDNLVGNADEDEGNSVTSLSISGITPKGDSTLLLGFVGSDNADVNDGSPNTHSGYAIANASLTWTEREDQGIADNGNIDPGLGGATAVYDSVSATGNFSGDTNEAADMYAAIVSVSEDSDVVVTPSAVSVDTNAVAPSVSGDANVVVTPVSAGTDENAPTVSVTGEPNVSQQGRNTANVDNQSRS